MRFKLAVVVFGILMIAGSSFWMGMQTEHLREVSDTAVHMKVADPSDPNVQIQDAAVSPWTTGFLAMAYASELSPQAVKVNTEGDAVAIRADRQGYVYARIYNEDELVARLARACLIPDPQP